ncbi:AMP-binding protein [Endozoicomonas sp. SM1973]|uniref:AMP-binding protein n=1 Tax=Spartinivicinus marinus TaxID=2994442 RepID=A0A853I9H1_9GAMM|nr:AMP-binding protein [Spartinivicinus marinus]MCX4030122.1 AMP-binding protein [Spartinivicinus marinus]NYZ69539.1 AMP-binding protein [Spartinivicinus marinus]
MNDFFVRNNFEQRGGRKGFRCINKENLVAAGYIDALSEVVDTDIKNNKNCETVFNLLCESTAAYKNLSCDVTNNGSGQIALKVAYRDLSARVFVSFFMELDRQNLLASVVCSYLFSTHKIVCLPAEGKTKKIFFNISGALTKDELDTIVFAVDTLLEIMSIQRSDKLLAHMASNVVDGEDVAYLHSHIPKDTARACCGDKKLTCFVYPNFIADLKKWDTSLVTFNKQSLMEVWLYLCDRMQPFVLQSYVIDNTKTEVCVVVLPTLYEKIVEGGEDYAVSLLDQGLVLVGNSDGVVIPPEMKKIMTSIKSEEGGEKLDIDGDIFRFAQIKEVLKHIAQEKSTTTERIKIAVLSDDRAAPHLHSLISQYDCFNIVTGYDASVVVVFPTATFWNLQAYEQLSVCIDLQGSVLDRDGCMQRRAGLLMISDVHYDLPERSCQRARSYISGAMVLNSLMQSAIMAKHTALLETFSLTGSTVEDITSGVASYGGVRPQLISQYGPVVQGEIESALRFQRDMVMQRSRTYSEVSHVIQTRNTLKTLDDDKTNLCHFIFREGRNSALIDPNTGDQLSYEGLREKVKSCARKFDEYRLKEGNIVALAAIDSIESVVIMLACFWRGLVFCPINYTASTENIGKMLEAAAPSIMICDVETIALKLPTLFDGLTVTLDSVVACDSGEADVGVAETPALLPREHPAVVLFTSGATGSPKALIHEHKDFILCNMNYTHTVVGLELGECVYTPSRIFFAYGLNSIVVSLFSGAVHVIAAPLAKGKSYIEILKQFSVNIFFTVPTVLKMMLQQHVIEHCDCPALRLCISAGEALPEALYMEAKQMLATDVLDGIGTTEVLSTFISNRDGYSRPGSSGQLVPGFSVKLINSDGSACQVGEVGSLWVKGNTLTKGYINDAKSVNAESFSDGWFNTKDLYYVDAEGFYYHIGRTGTTLKINGCWFSPQTLEQVLTKHPKVKESAVWFNKDEFGLTRPSALIVLAEEVSDLMPLWRELKEFARDKLGKAHYPHLFRSVDSLPRTSSGKLIRYALPDLI